MRHPLPAAPISLAPPLIKATLFSSPIGFLRSGKERRLICPASYQAIEHREEKHNRLLVLRSLHLDQRAAQFVCNLKLVLDAFKVSGSVGVLDHGDDFSVGEGVVNVGGSRV